MAARIYATAEQLAEYVSDLGAAEAKDLLRQSSLIVDDLLSNSRYSVDEDDMPTEDGVKETLQEAVCLQARFLHEAGGFEAFTSAGQGPSQLGSLRFDGNSSTDGGSAASAASPEVVLRLKVEGLLSSRVRVLR